MRKNSSSRLLRYICSLIVVLLLTGCASGNTNMSGDSPAEEERVEMTEEEKALLKRVFLGEERIEEGELFGYQKTFLNHSRTAKEYLNRKYPSYDFIILDGENITKDRRMAKFFFYERDKFDDALTYNELFIVDVFVDVEDSAKVVNIEDTFFCEIVKDDFEDFFESLLLEEGIRIRDVTIRFSNALGEQYGESVTVEDILSMKISTMVFFSLCAEDIEGEDYEGATKRIEQLIFEKKIHGGFMIDIFEDESFNNRVFTYSFLCK